MGEVALAAARVVVAASSVAGSIVVAGLALAILALAFVLGGCSLAAALAAEEASDLEVVDLVAPSEDEVGGGCLVDLGGGHAECEHARLAVLCLQGHVVLQRDVQSEQWRKGFVDADGGDVVHRGWDVASGGGVLNVAEVRSVHVFHPG